MESEKAPNIGNISGPNKTTRAVEAMGDIAGNEGAEVLPIMPPSGEDFDFDTIDWGKSYTLAFLYTNESKLHVFQFKFLHRKLATKCFLLKT